MKAGLVIAEGLFLIRLNIVFIYEVSKYLICDI
jgi:hypothetical protein